MHHRPGFTRAESMPLDHPSSHRVASTMGALQRADSMHCPAPSLPQQQQGTTGPRTQCDQIVHEAMVKACEIVVRGRCSEFLDRFGGGSNNKATTNLASGGYNYSSSYGAPSRVHPPSQSSTQPNHHRATNSRFNLEVDEVPQVRQTLNTWRQNLNVPLRLDIYYEHYDDDDALQRQHERTPQRELLERWCIDYHVPSDHGPLPLRALCKRIVVLLRSLHCYSIYTPPYVETSLPSPSFARKDLPSIPAGYGTLTLSVMYDATLSHYDQRPVAYYAPEIAHRNGRERNASRSHPIPIQNPAQKIMQDVPPSSGSKVQTSVAVSDYIISNYHSPTLPPVALNARHTLDEHDDNRSNNGYGKNIKTEKQQEEEKEEEGEKQQRVMSGLSLAMMGEEDGSTLRRIPPPPQQHPPSNTDEDKPLPSWGSPATRAAFHLPPGYTENGGDGRASSAGEGREGGNYFAHHGGYGYGYVGGQIAVLEGHEPPPPPMGSLGGNDGLSISPSPLISTPPQAMWGKPRQMTVGGGEETLARIQRVEEGALDHDVVGDDAVAPPFTNPTSLQPLPLSSASRSASHAASLSHVATTSYGSSPHNHAGLEKSLDHPRKRTSSSSVLLPPVTSLDLLQKSPFSITKMMAMGAESASGIERADSDGLAMPFILESYRDEMLTSSIPRMISADSRQRTSSIGGYTPGTGSSSNPILLPFGSLASISGWYYNTGPLSSTRSSGGQHSHHIDADEMPFAVDDDFPSIGGASSPFTGRGSKSLWGSTKTDILDGTSTMNGLSEATSSLAVSSLHQRCATEGKPRLKLFESSQSIKLSSRNSDATENPSKNDYATIKEQLSDFCSFGASLMIGSIHDSRSE
ncbi:hypothetical protein ACHAW6_003924 [Cyclotella cf. meneghiniana]